MRFLLVVMSILRTTGALSSVVPLVPLCDYEGCPMVSAIGAGALHLGDRNGLKNVEDINSWIRAAVDLGITLFDLSDAYPVRGGESGQSAVLFGKALALTPGLRENITIVGKMGTVGLSSIDSSPAHLNKTLAWYLDVLGTSYLDILMLHFPDSFMDATAVAVAFQDFRDHEQVRFFGVSNHATSHFDLLDLKMKNTAAKGASAVQGLVTHEFEFSVWNPSAANYDNDLLDHATLKGFRPLVWGALGGDPLGGMNRLFGRHSLRGKKIMRALSKVASAVNLEGQEDLVAVSWILSHPVNAIPLLGTTDITRLTRQSGGAGSQIVTLTHDQWWDIATAGGICVLADIQCSYDEYRLPLEPLPNPPKTSV